MKRLSTILLPLVLFAATSYTGATQAATIVNQPPQLGDIGVFTESDFGTPREAGDIFSLFYAADQFEATWYGLYVTDGQQPAPPMATDIFSVGFYAINGGVVDTAPTASLTGTDLAVTRTVAPIDTSYGFSVYGYSATLDLASLAVPITLPVGDYLFSVANDSTGAGDVNWFWRSSSTGSPQAQGRALVNGAWQEITAFGGIELAYTLKTVPTPTSISIMLAALGILGVTRRRYKSNNIAA